MLIRVLKFLDNNAPLNKHQHSFRPMHSTVTAMTEFLNNVITALDNKEHALALFIDVAKAFDSIDHHILFRKLETYGLRGVVLDWFRDYLSNRFQFIETNYDSSALKSVRCGMPQGSVLGPMIFLLYINDLPSIHNDIKSVLYADDTTLIVTDRDVNRLYMRAAVLFNYASVWFNSNKLALNVKKTNLWSL
jgi:retron-type reverse transcriptase